MNLRGLLFAVLTSTVWAQKPAPPAPPPPSAGCAIEAVRLLPRESARRLARIEAREGRPKPERWYVLVHEPETPLGMREFVVSNSKIVAARGLSQFADKLTLNDAFGDQYLRADSDYCAQVALVYATLNGTRPASINYELARPPIPPGSEPPPPPPPSPVAPTPTPKPKPNAGPAKPPPPPPPIVPPARPENAWPVWRLTVLDAKGDQLGVLTVNAARGTVLSHEGFDKVPDPSQLPELPSPPPGHLYPPKQPEPKAKPAGSGKSKPSKPKKSKP